MWGVEGMRRVPGRITKAVDTGGEMSAEGQRSACRTGQAGELQGQADNMQVICCGLDRKERCPLKPAGHPGCVLPHLGMREGPCLIDLRHW